MEKGILQSIISTFDEKEDDNTKVYSILYSNNLFINTFNYFNNNNNNNTI